MTGATEDRTYIDAPDAARLLDFACAVYGLLLRTLVASFGRGGPNAAEDRAALLGVSFGLMHVLGAAATALARLLASPDAPGVHAGMTFTMLRGTEPLIAGEVEQVVITERLRALARVAAELPSIGAEAADSLRSLGSDFTIHA